MSGLEPDPADMARAGFLVRCRAWRHLKVEFCGHPYVPLAALSGAIADASIETPNDLLTPAHIVRAAEKAGNREIVADILQALGGGHV